MNRRNLLKVFGTGAVIAPVVGGEVLAEPLARIITPPEVKILEGKAELLKPTVDQPLSMTDIQSVDMTLNYKDGTKRVIHGVANTWNDDTDTDNWGRGRKSPDFVPFVPVVPGDTLLIHATITVPMSPSVYGWLLTGVGKIG